MSLETLARGMASAAPVKGTGWRAAGATPAVLTAEVGSRFLYVAEQGALLRREGSRLRVTKKDSLLLEVPAMKLQAVALYGNVQVTSQCLRALLDEGVSVGIFTRNGIYKGRLQGPVDRGGALRRKQWTCAADPGFCLSFGRAIVRGKLLGAKQVAAAYAKNYVAATLGHAHEALTDAIERIDEAPDADVLRGIEGSAARAWFDLFARCNRSEFAFERRVKRPPPDPLNALLSFGYTLVLRELDGLVEAAGLDPAVGFYHTAHANRPALACDWVEEFRHVLIDRLVLSLVNLKVVRPEHFVDLEDRGLRMTPEGLRAFLAAYERALLAGINDGPTPGGYRAVFLQQLGRLLDAIGGRAPYRSHLEPPADETDDHVTALDGLGGA